MIKLIFLGTRANIEEKSKKHRYHSSLLIKNKSKILIDYGLISKKKLNEIKPNAILITHAHPDHYAWTEKEIKTKIPVYLTKETLNYGKFKPKNPKLIKPGKKFKIKEFEILPYKVLHSIRCPAIGFKIRTNKKNIIYTGDLIDIKNKKKILNSADYYIGDGSCIKANLIRRKGNKIFGHARIPTQIKWCKENKINNIIFTHLGKETIKKEKEFSKKNPKIIFAEDEMIKKIK